MDLIDFSWLYLNEELSDFKLVIRPIERHPQAVAAATTHAESARRGPGGVQTRSRKRTCPQGTLLPAGEAAAANATSADEVLAAKAAAASNGRRTRQRGGASEPQAAAPAGQQRPPAQQQQPADQQQAQQGVGDAPQGHPQQQQQVAAGPVRRTRRQAAATPPPAAAAEPPDGAEPAAAEGGAAGGSSGGRNGRRPRGERHARLQQEQQQQQQEQPPGAAAEEAAWAPPAPRVTRSRYRAGPQQEGGEVAAAGALRQRGAAGASNHTGQPPQQQQQQGGPAGAPPSTTAGTAPSSSRAGPSQQQQQQVVPPGVGVGPCAGSEEGPDPLCNLPPGSVVLPVHAAVLSGTSEYFKLLIRGWAAGLRQVLTLEVEAGEVGAAQHMVRFMYTGRLPEGVPPEQLLVMIRLADKYQVGRFLSAANTAFDRLPLDGLDLGAALGVWELPGVMLDSPGLAGVLAKATDKLLEVFGDLEKVWCHEGARQDWLRLPARAVATLLGHEATSVHNENTALVALGAWLEGAPGAAGLGAGQRAELLSLVRLPYLTSSYLRDVLPGLPWAADLLEPAPLLNAFQYAVASEATRQRLAGLAPEPGPAAARPGAANAGLTPHFRAPRPSSSLNKLSFEWVIELSTIKRMAADARLWGRVVELQSPLYYWAGFYWQLLFNVERTTPPDASPDHGPVPPGGGGVLEFVGVRCHASVGRADFWPRLVRFKANIAALQAGFWEMDYLYSKALEGHIVDGVGLGYPGFFALGGGAGGLDADAAWSRFARNNRISLRCEVYECE